MAAGTATIGGRQYAVGLYWENSPGGGRVTQIAKEAAKQPGTQAEFYVVRPGNNDGRVAQFGLCSSEAGQKAGMPALAGCLANQVPGSWVGAFRLSEGVIVTVVRDDLIVPDGDVFFQDEAEARDRLIQEIGFGGLQTTYAPESWSIPGADTIPLTLLLNNRQDIKLQQVSIPKKVKIIAASVGLLLIVLVGGVWYWQAQEAEEEARAAAAAALAHPSPMSLFQDNKPPEPKYVRVWENEPQPMAAIEACRAGLSSIPAAVAGWKISGVKCAKSNMAVTWAFDKGMATIPEGAQLDDVGKTASKSIGLTVLPARGAETLLDPTDVLKRYLAQNWGVGLSVAADDPPPPPPPGYTGEWHPPPPPWVKRSFTLTVPELPSTLAEYFDGLPGLIVNSISLAPAGVGGTWSIEGIIYENRK